MKNLFSFIAFMLLTSTFAQKGTISGTLTDKDMNNETLPFANVMIQGTTVGTTSDMDGAYSLSIEPGQYTIVFSFLGYKTETETVTVVAGQNVVVNKAMGADSVQLEDVVVVSTVTREKESALLLEQKKATTIKQSIGAQELARKGVSDAAAAVSKISGISKQEGGGNVYVRGLGDRYLNTTYNGLPLPSNDIEKKNIDLDLFSSDVIQNVGVSKTFSPELYGDFAAGNVDVVAKEYTGNGFFDIELGSGFNSNSIGKTFYRNQDTGFFGTYNNYGMDPYDVMLTKGIDPLTTNNTIALNGSMAGGKSWSFGEASRLSVFATVSFGNGYDYFEGTAVDYTTTIKKSFPNFEEYEYTSNITGMANIVYRISNTSKIKFNSLTINDSKDQVGFYGTKGLGTNRDAILDTDKGYYVSNYQFDQTTIMVNQLTGDHDFGKKVEVEWGLGYNNVLSRQPDRKRFSIEQYHFAFDNDPSTSPSFFSNIPYDNQRYFQNIEDNEYNARLNLKYEVSEKTTFNIGYNGRNKVRNFDNIRYGYDIIRAQRNITGDVRNSFDSYFDQNNLNTNYTTAVFNSLNDTTSPTNNPGSLENTYKGTLMVNAGYLNAAFKLGEKFVLVPGVRLEQFTQKIKYDVINLVPTDPGFRNAEELFILPSLNLKYAITDKQNLRFSLSKTVSNPEFKEVAPFVYEDVTQRIGGNPDLLNDPTFSEVYNIDFKYELFMKSSEIFSLGLFGKQINNPVNLVVANDATGTQRFFRTGDKATVYGAELELRKGIINNSDDNAVLSIGFNTTYTYTMQDLKTVNGIFGATFNRAEDQLQGASPILVNGDISFSPEFENYKPIVNVVVSYFSDRIQALGSGQLGNIIEKSVPTLDFVWKNEIKENFEINIKARNLLNPNIQFIRENTSDGDVTILEYKRGVDVSLQLKYSF